MATQTADSATPQRLAALLHGFAPVMPDADREITGLALDSRQVKRGDLFFACAGGRVHGMRFIDEVVRAGAAAVVYDAESAVTPPGAKSDVPLIAVQRLADQLGPIAARFHRQPSRDLAVIGITGTNGKTSCCHYLAQAFSADGTPCGVLGTLGYGVYGALRPGSYTTPDALTLQQELARLRDAGVGRVVMEVSSHALVEGRTLGVDFAAAVFTNLSHDHLDYHGDLDSYGRAKRQLFTVPGLRFAVINRSDSFGRKLIDDFGAQLACTSFALGEAADVSGKIVASSTAGMTLAIRSRWGEGTLQVGLLGRFNAENLLAVLAVLLLMDVPFDEAMRRAGALRPVPGRMERFGGGPGQALAIVDYAHTPDALSQVLSTLRAHCAGRLICVFGCGGERDRGKRPLMGAVAARHADHIILTNDNPRGEEPGAIIAEILAGIPSMAGVDVVPDRGEAIRAALAMASAGDIVLVAGKGHEDYQQIGEQRLPFSDRAVVGAAMGVRSWQ